MYLSNPSHKVLASLLEFQKTTLNNTFSTMIMLQKETERLMTRFMKQVPDVAPEGKNILEDWYALCNQAREHYMETLSHGFQASEELS
jgi:hypothetical protein